MLAPLAIASSTLGAFGFTTLAADSAGAGASYIPLLTALVTAVGGVGVAYFASPRRKDKSSGDEEADKHVGELSDEQLEKVAQALAKIAQTPVQKAVTRRRRKVPVSEEDQ